MDERLMIKENYDLLLEIFCHTFSIVDIKTTTLLDDFTLDYADVKEKFMNYIGRIITGKCLIEVTGENRYRICMKAILSFFSIFGSKASLIRVKVLQEYQEQREELVEFTKNLDFFLNATNPSYQHIEEIFDIIRSAIVKTNDHYLEEEKLYGIGYTPEATLLEGINEILIQTEFNICLHPIAAKSSKIWEKMELSCGKLIKNRGTRDGLIYIWKMSIISATSNLVNALINTSEEEFEIFKDPLILPFEGLTMKNEYILQVLFNAFNNKDNPYYKDNHKYNDGEAKYNKVLQSSVYKSHFDTWFKLFQLFKIALEPDNSKILYDYILSKCLQ